MTKRVWPRCSESGCDVAVREIAGSYPGKRLAEPDGRCSRHAITDTTYEAPPVVDVIEPDDAEGVDTTEEIADSSKSVESLRVALGEGLFNQNVAHLLRSSLLGGLDSAKSAFATCPHCKKRHPVTLPDLGARATAAKTIVELVEGRLKERATAEEQLLDREATKIRTDFSDMTNEELSRYIARLEEEVAAESAES